MINEKMLELILLRGLLFGPCERVGKDQLEQMMSRKTELEKEFLEQYK